MKMILPAAFAVVATSAVFASVPNPKPGKWQHHGKVVSAKIPGVPGFVAKIVAAPKSRSSCLTAKQSASAPEHLFRTPEMNCTPGSFTMSNGQISGTASCTFKKEPVRLTISATGSYNATSYTMRNVTTGMRDGKPVSIVTTGTGKWASGTCS